MMKLANKLKRNSILSIITISLALYLLPIQQVKKLAITESRASVVGPPNVELFFALKKYSAEYNVPERYAFAIAKNETSYNGLLHWNYKHSQVSDVNALGPMQVLLSTARLFDRSVTKEELQHNIDKNVKISMQILSHNKRVFGSWKRAIAAYNTGNPNIENSYVRNTLNYK